MNAPDLFKSAESSIKDRFPFLSTPPASPKKSRPVKFSIDSKGAELAKSETLEKALVSVLGGGGRTIERLAFEISPQHGKYVAIYKPKTRGVPDSFLKRIAIQDDLVAAIVRAREMQLGAFGRPRSSRFKTGFKINANAGVLDNLSDLQKKELHKKIAAATKRLNTCGDTEEVAKKDQMSFSTYLQMSARNAVVLGRIATEIIGKPQTSGAKDQFHHFRPVDVGTIFFANPQDAGQAGVRERSKTALEQLKALSLEVEGAATPAKFDWVQVIEGIPQQVFTDEELAVFNFDPVADWENDGYPVPPLDTCIKAVLTHLNITQHNQLYFQTGRAARGMLVFKSDDVDEATLKTIQQNFQASINGVGNSWRLPTFSISPNDEVEFITMDGASRDAEFTYLTDMNARSILSAFMMSPDELPGWAYLSKGPNSQALSESNNQFHMTAARDVGIRPLLTKFEDFINGVLFPLIDPELALMCRVDLAGLDADTEEKESVRIQQDSALHMTTNQILEKVEKKPLPKKFGGDFLLNPQWQSVIDKYVPVGVIMEEFFDVPGASQDPRYAYLRDAFFFQQVQAMTAAAQAAAAPPPGAAPPGSEGDTTPDQPEDQQQPVGDGGEELTRSIDQAIGLLTKSEEQLPQSQRRLLSQHRKLMERFTQGLEADLKEATKDIVEAAKKQAPKSN
jgi:hypothetical protein